MFGSINKNANQQSSTVMKNKGFDYLRNCSAILILHSSRLKLFSGASHLRQRGADSIVVKSQSQQSEVKCEGVLRVSVSRWLDNMNLNKKKCCTAIF